MHDLSCYASVQNDMAREGDAATWLAGAVSRHLLSGSHGGVVLDSLPMTTPQRNRTWPRTAASTPCHRAPRQRRTGLIRGMVVHCQVTGHRGRFGVEVQITSRAEKPAAFIDFVLIPGRGQRVAPEYFPPVGTELDAVVVAFMPNGELRLDAHTSAVQEWKEKGVRPESPSS